MKRSPRRVPGELLELKRIMAGILVRSKLDYTDDVLILNAFLRDFRWVRGVSPVEVRGLWKGLRKGGLPPAHMFSVYLHFPYCRSKCHYCYCNSKRSTGPAQLREYLDELKREIRFYAPLAAGVPVGMFQVGGGTPNLYSAEQLRYVLGFAKDSFRVEPGALWTIEFNPEFTTREKLRAVRDVGFNRISFGVQSLNPKVLKEINRSYQTLEKVRRAVAWAKEAGFECVNIDLLIGFQSDTVKSFLRTFDQAASVKPTMLTAAGLSLTDHYLKLVKTDRETELREHEQMLPGILRGMRRIAAARGYETEELTAEKGNWVLFAKDAPVRVQKRLERADHFSGGNVSIMGLGRGSRSYVFGQGVYERDMGDFAPSSPVYRMVPMSVREEMIRYIVYSLENSRGVPLAGFRRRFGKDVRKAFRLELKALKALGKVRVDKDRIRFLPVRGPERIFYGLFFLKETLAGLPFSRGLLTPELDRGLNRALAAVRLEGGGRV